MCETMCSIPSPRSAAPLMNYACRTGNNGLLMFCLQMQASVLQVTDVSETKSFFNHQHFDVVQNVVPKRSMTSMHLIAQFGHLELMQTILRVLNKTGLQKSLLMSDRCVCGCGCVCVCVCVCEGVGVGVGVCGWVGVCGCVCMWVCECVCVSVLALMIS
jgi:hypothetical protein